MAAQEGSKLRASDVADKYRETIDLMEELEEQKALTFHVLKRFIEDKSNFADKYTERIVDVQRFHSEVGQFEHDVRALESSNNTSKKKSAKKIAYEEEQAIKDMKSAAEAVIKFGELKEDALERKEKFKSEGRDLSALVMTDNYLVIEAILRDVVITTGMPTQRSES